MPTPERPAHRRFYTVEEANRILPLVRRIVEDIGAAARLYERTQNRLNLKGNSALGERDRRIAEEELSDHADRLEECLQELRSLGVEFRGWDGVVDFPAWVDGREIEYCWKAGEARVVHWHELYTGYSNRKPLPVTSPRVPDATLADAALEDYVPDDVTMPVSKPKAKATRRTVRRADDML
jgi:hypothetical protein